MMTGMGLEVMRLHSRQEFQTWLAKDLKVRDELEALIGVELGLDGGRSAPWRPSDDALRLGEHEVLDAAARHIGLVMLLNGAQWAIDLDDEDSAYYRPVVRLADGAKACPLTLATAALDRRTGENLRTVVENYKAEHNTAKTTDGTRRTVHGDDTARPAQRVAL